VALDVMVYLDYLVLKVKWAWLVFLVRMVTPALMAFPVTLEKRVILVYLEIVAFLDIEVLMAYLVLKVKVEYLALMVSLVDQD
jgi:hypothetical protein